MRLIKNNFYTVVRLWLNQFAMMFFGILILLPTANSSIVWLMPAASIFAVLFYLVLLFWTCCEVGLNDSVKIESGKMKRQWYKCTTLAFVANTPAIIACIGASVAKAFIPSVGYFSSVAGAQGAAASVCSVFMIIGEVLHIMYQGFFVFMGWDVLPFIYLLPVILSLAACTFGYIGGTKGLFARLLSRKKDR